MGGRAVFEHVPNALTRCQASSKSNRSTRSIHLRRWLAPTWRSDCEGQLAGASACDSNQRPGQPPIIAAVTDFHRWVPGTDADANSDAGQTDTPTTRSPGYTTREGREALPLREVGGRWACYATISEATGGSSNSATALVSRFKARPRSGPMEPMGRSKSSATSW